MHAPRRSTQGLCGVRKACAACVLKQGARIMRKKNGRPWLRPRVRACGSERRVGAQVILDRLTHPRLSSHVVCVWGEGGVRGEGRRGGRLIRQQCWTG